VCVCFFGAFLLILLLQLVPREIDMQRRQRGIEHIEFVSEVFE
jgi:hypothetical protein